MQRGREAERESGRGTKRQRNKETERRKTERQRDRNTEKMEIYPILKTHRRKTFPHLQSRLRGGVARRPGQCPHGGLEQREGDGVVATDGEEGGVGVDQGRRECDHIAVAL